MEDFTAEKPESTNQDTFIIAPNLDKTLGLHLFAVADGHGDYGYEITDYIQSMLPMIIKQLILSQKVLNVGKLLSQSYQ